jgi:hypothetical protein
VARGLGGIAAAPLLLALGCEAVGWDDTGGFENKGMVVRASDDARAPFFEFVGNIHDFEVSRCNSDRGECTTDSTYCEWLGFSRTIWHTAVAPPRFVRDENGLTIEDENGVPVENDYMAPEGPRASGPGFSGPVQFGHAPEGAPWTELYFEALSPGVLYMAKGKGYDGPCDSSSPCLIVENVVCAFFEVNTDGSVLVR